jgi:hypothetical protein
MGKTVTDDSGIYALDVQANTRVYIRVTAQISDGSDSAPAYLVKVHDNTAPEYAKSALSAPVYSMRGDVFTVRPGGTNVDLNAGSGWTGGAYGAPRTAAPFAILDQIETAAKKMRAAEPDVSLPALDVFWSTANRPAAGEKAQGMIGTSHFDPKAATRGLYILGAENVDTDEYDGSVIVHEFGHYVEFALSRSDSIGGSHGNGDALDMRVAFGEGFGNAFSSMMRNTPVYTDTIGPRQAQVSVSMNLSEISPKGASAWFDESAVGYTLYSLYASPDVGFGPIYHALLNGEKNTPALTSIFSFATALRPGLSDSGKSTLDQLLAKILVPGGTLLDEWGTNIDSGKLSQPVNSAILPVYARLSPDATATSCTTTQFGAGNKLGNYGHVRMSIPHVGAYSLRLVSAADGPSVSDYELYVYRFGKEVNAISTDGTSKAFAFTAAGDYVVEVQPKGNDDEDTSPSAAPVCVSVTLREGM